MLPRSKLRGRSLLAAGLALCVASTLGTVSATATAAAARPDLTATKGSVSVSGSTVSGRFTVRNVGGRAAPVSTAYVQARTGTRWRYFTELRILRLPAGKSGKYNFRTAAPSWMNGTHRLRVCLDVKKKVREVREGNNCLALGTVTMSGDPVEPGPIDYTPDSRFLLGTKASGYYGWVPGGYDDTHQTPSPLFVWLHGCGGHSQYDITSFHPAPTESYVMIAPTGREGACWSTPRSGAGDDALVLRAIRDVSTRFNIDPGEVVLGGYSSGGDLSYRVAYRNSEEIDAVLAANTSPFRDTGLTRAEALAAATTKFRVEHLAHTGDTVYPIATVRSELQALVDAGFRVTSVERPGTHYDEPGPGVPGTDADIRAYLLPKVDP